MEILIKSVEVIDRPSEFHKKRRNVLIKDGIISDITTRNLPAAKIIDGRGLILTIGWCDMRAHFCDPGNEAKEDLESGRRAAADGGFTDVVLQPNTSPPVTSKNEVSYLLSGNQRSLTQVHVIGAVTNGTSGLEVTEMIDLHTAGAVAFSDGIEPLWHTDVFGKALQYLQKFNGLLINRAEDKMLSAYGHMNEGLQSTILGIPGIPKLSEEVMVARDLALLEYYGGRLHFANISSERSLQMIKAAKRKGLTVSCDVAVHQLILDDNMLVNFDTNYKVNPPLRGKKTIKALLNGIKDGTIEVIVSDHRPEDEEGKKLEFDLASFGILGLQELGAMLQQIATIVDIEVLLACITYKPRELLGIKIPKIEVGSEAILTLYDPKRSWQYNQATNRSKSRNSPFYGKELTGKAVGVFSNGKFQLDQGLQAK
ncbi:MAG: dihydroorotase [Cyclobacteriaceae bacterium]|nr:MAG: dihydroorotase [Cyclobacteriaceae bacterium]